MSIFTEQKLDSNIKDYLNNEIVNPILQKVIEEEFIYSSNLANIIKNHFSNAITSDNYTNKFSSLNTLIKNVSKDNYNYLREQLTNGFVNLDVDQHLYMIINIIPTTESLFEVMSNNPTTSNILKNILSGLCIGVNDEYIIKCIESCKIINKTISDSIVKEYIINNSCDIVMNDNLLPYFIKYISESKDHSQYDIIFPVFNIKLTSIMENIAKFELTNMEFAYEIYKLGKIIIDGCVKFNKLYLWSIDIMVFSNEQLDYIAKSVHTCIMNKNIPQAQMIHAIIYYMNMSQGNKYMKYYIKYFQQRLKLVDHTSILSDEYTLWNINNEYKTIINKYDISEYKQYINNIKYSQIINNDIQKIKKLNTINVTLENELVSNIENVNHHPFVMEYINNLNKYIGVKAPLQKIEYSMNQSKIKFKTKMGSIKCSLISGSCLLYLQDSPMTIDELSKKVNIGKDEVQNIIDILYFNNIVITSENKYKYVEPFGEVDCCSVTMKIKKEEDDIVINKFTDIIMTMDSRIIKEVKPAKMNIMELERRILEFMGDSYVRNIFYQRVDMLKKKYYITEVDSIIEYVV